MAAVMLDPVSPRDDNITSVSTDAQASTANKNDEAERTTLEPFDTIEDPAVASEAENEYPTGAKFWFIALSMALLLLVGGMDALIIATAVPSITDRFHTVADIGWYAVPHYYQRGCTRDSGALLIPLLGE